MYDILIVDIYICAPFTQLHVTCLRVRWWYIIQIVTIDEWLCDIYPLKTIYRGANLLQMHVTHQLVTNVGIYLVSTAWLTFWDVIVLNMTIVVFDLQKADQLYVFGTACCGLPLLNTESCNHMTYAIGLT